MAPASTQALWNPLASPSVPTPSSIEGVSEELERELRFYGALLIQQAGILLDLPQVVMSTASTLFQRFYFVTSMKHFGIRDMSAGALFLASKLEEKPARIRDIVNVYDYLFSLIGSYSTSDGVGEMEKDQVREAQRKMLENPLLPAAVKEGLLKKLKEEEGKGKTREVRRDGMGMGNGSGREGWEYKPMELFAAVFYERKEDISIAEMHILKRLGFHVQVQHPYSAMVNYLQVLNLTSHSTIPQLAWSYLNDCLLTPLPALHPTTHLSTLAIYLALKDAKISLPTKWWELFDVESEGELKAMGEVVRGIYAAPGVGKEGVTVWERVAGLPVTKEGVRRRIEEGRA